MRTNWKVENGHLLARTEMGSLVRRLIVDEAIGRLLAAFLNGDPDLSRSLLWPVGKPNHGVGDRWSRTVDEREEGSDALGRF